MASVRINEKTIQRVHNERAVFEAYIKRRDMTNRQVHSLQFKAELVLNRANDRETFKALQKSLTSSVDALHYADQEVQLIWEGWELANNSNIPVELLSKDIPKLSRLETQIVSEYGWAPYVTGHYSQTGDYIHSDEISYFISECRRHNIPDAAILKKIANLF